MLKKRQPEIRAKIEENNLNIKTAIRSFYCDKCIEKIAKRTAKKAAEKKAKRVAEISEGRDVTCKNSNCQNIVIEINPSTMKPYNRCVTCRHGDNKREAKRLVDIRKATPGKWL